VLKRYVCYELCVVCYGVFFVCYNPNPAHIPLLNKKNLRRKLTELDSAPANSQPLKSGNITTRKSPKV
jgi:hypothetical protein